MSTSADTPGVPSPAGPASRGESSAFWEAHYAGMTPAKTRANALLVEVASSLVAGVALDLGCGGGGDTIWLAKRGWEVTAVDVSPTAVARVAARAHAEGVARRVHAERHDLADSIPAGSFDLINVHYLHSPVRFDREAILRGLAAQVNGGGTLLLVDHASVSPWSWADPATVFPTPQQTRMAIGLDLDEWRVERIDAPQRDVTGPAGQHALVTDTVIALTKES